MTSNANISRAVVTADVKRARRWVASVDTGSGKAIAHRANRRSVRQTIAALLPDQVGETLLDTPRYTGWDVA